MISFKQAIDIIQKNTNALAVESFPLKNAIGLTLAEDICANGDFPPFEQAAMDGYALRFDDWNGDALEIAGEAQAGIKPDILPDEKEAVRIFTGAPLPAGLDTVVVQEKVIVEDNRLLILDKELKKGRNVRPQGSEMTKGSFVLEEGTVLTPGAIGFIAGLGRKEVKAFKKPSVAIIVTGKELKEPGQSLAFGQIFDSNSFAINAALQQIGITDITIQLVDDEMDSLLTAVQKALSKDLVIITGGVSEGDYDFVTRVLEECGVNKLIHKVKQRPGKPFLYGKKNETSIFGLPGNPAAALICFYEYVLLAIQLMLGSAKPYLTNVRLALACDYTKKPHLQYFLKGRLVNDEVMVLDAQESYKMRSFALADCLIVLEQDRTDYKKGEMVEVHILP